MKALILVDLQNDFMPGGALAVREGDQIVPLANHLMKGFSVVIATQDWHPQNHESFSAAHPGRNPGDVIDLHGLTQILWPAHCVQHTKGAEFHPNLNQAGFTGVIRKGQNPKIDSYSGFFDNGGQQATGLESVLRGKGVTEVFVLGLATDYCVKFTAIDAHRLGFNTHLIVDACRGVNLRPGDVAAAIEEMRQAGIHVCQSDEIAL